MSEPTYAQLAGSPATEADSVAELAHAAADPSPLGLGEVYSVLVPDGYQHVVFDMEKHADSPYRARGTYRPATVDALISHVARHHDENHSTIWVHPSNGRIITVFNDHANDGSTGWGDHRSQLDLQHTPEWMFWRSKDMQLVSQTSFAEHVEYGLKEIVEPPAADMLELAQSFHAAHSATFRSATRLQDGNVQIQYDEELEAQAGRSKQIPVPQEFTLAIAPFLGEEPYRVTARLRYRLSAGKLTLGYQLHRPDDIVRDALAQIAERLTEKFTHVFLGEPPAA